MALEQMITTRADEVAGRDPAGDLDAELAQLTTVESLVANINAGSCSNATAVCSGGVCCM